MKTIREINQLIWEIDNQPHIERYGFYVDGLFISFWMLIRKRIFLELAAIIGYGPSNDAKIKSSIIQKIKFFINAFYYRPKLKKTEFLFISPSVGNIDHGQTVENIYHDLFAKSLVRQGKNILILEQPNRLWCLFKKHDFNLTAYSMTWLHLKRRIKTFILGNFVKVDKQNVDNFLDCLDLSLEKKVMNRKTLIQKTKQELLQLVKYSNYYVEMWEQIAKSVQPRMVMMQDICCGGNHAIASLVFKKNRVLVVEDQHGFIDAEDTQFNYSEKLESNFFRFMPDYFLFYGSRWLKNMNINTKKTVIGNPFHSKSKEKFKHRKMAYDLLVISDSERPEVTINKLNFLLTNSHYTMLFRPHPKEFPYAMDRYGLILENKNITLDPNRDVFESMSRCKVVVCMVGSYLSTVVCEALSFNKQTLCFCDNISVLSGKDMFSEYIRLYEKDGELLEDLKIIINKDITNKDSFNQFYVSDWQKNFNEWITSIY